MTPLERFEADLTKLQNDGCKTDATVQRVRQDYKQQAAQNRRSILEKQAQEREKRGWT